MDYMYINVEIHAPVLTVTYDALHIVVRQSVVQGIGCIENSHACSGIFMS